MLKFSFFLKLFYKIFNREFCQKGGLQALSHSILFLRFTGNYFFIRQDQLF